MKEKETSNELNQNEREFRNKENVSGEQKAVENEVQEGDSTRKPFFKKRDYNSSGNRFSGEKKQGRFFNYRVKKCAFCEKSGEELKNFLNYKNHEHLRKYISERGRILSSRITGTCNIHQRILQKEIKKARCMALLPYSKIIKLTK